MKEFILEISIENMESQVCSKCKFSIQGFSNPSNFGFAYPLETLDRVDEVIEINCDPEKWGFAIGEVKIIPKIIKDIRQKNIFAWCL